MGGVNDGVLNIGSTIDFDQSFNVEQNQSFESNTRLPARHTGQDGHAPQRFDAFRIPVINTESN